MKIEMHLLQNFAPSCLNRDDSNAPKECEFGGVRRARVSSQCLKRAIRIYFKENGTQEIGTRTKRLRQAIVSRLTDVEPIELIPDATDLLIETYYSKLDGKRLDETAVLLYLSEAEIGAAAAAIRELWPTLQPKALERKLAVEAIEAEKARLAQEAEEAKDKGETPATTRGKGKKEAPKLPTLEYDKSIADSLNAALSADIALFGRMLAEQTGKNVDAACQVAHALSTHRVDIDFDFYAAVDDLKTREEMGAGMLGLTGFNSPCYYRYALVDQIQLNHNLGGKLSSNDVIRDFLWASVHAIPNAKQNSMSSPTPPSFGMFVVRSSGSPCSLANAFAKPIDIQDNSNPDIIGTSVAEIGGYWDRYQSVYGSEGIASVSLFALDGKERLTPSLQAADRGSVRAAIDAAINALKNAEAAQ